MRPSIGFSDNRFAQNRRDVQALARVIGGYETIGNLR
jgi:hypothetical protein